MRHRPFSGTSTRSCKCAVNFLAGVVCTMALYSAMYPFQLLQSTEQKNINYNSGDRRDLLVTLPTLNVLLLEVHLEGNLGDEMETSPLLEFLKQKRKHFQISITAALSGWLEGPEKQLSYRSVREHDKIDHILSMEGLLSNATNINEDYDLIVLAPGPWKLCRLLNVVWKKPFRIDVLFGGSIMAESSIEGSNAESCVLESLLKIWRPQMVAVRETISFRKLQLSKGSIFGPNSPIISMSGDLSHSFRYSSATLEYWKNIYGDSTRYPANMSLIFPRANNAEQSVSFKGRTVVIETWTMNESNSSVVLPGQQVIFATSSAIEDFSVFQDWMYKHYNRFKPHQFVTCDTVEQLFGLISNAQHVYTDRYHPGVAAHVLGIEFSIIRYEEERDKLIGLRDLVYKEQYSASTVHDEFNAKSFDILEGILEGRIRNKLGRN
jgi:hypothetical protein